MTSMVRTFRAPDARSALAAVKAAMGSEAVILSTQQVGGGLFQRPEVEVTAALEPKAEPPSTQSAPLPVAHGAARYQAPAPPRPDSIGGAVMHASMVGEELIALRSAVESLRSQMRKPPAATPFPAAVMPLHEHLCARGLEPSVVEELLRHGADAHGQHLGGLWQGVRSLLAQRLVAGRAPWMPGPRRVIALVGPTGVGKTTTLAKIAARAVLDTKIKVALITVDSYRIGAAEQVTRYGSMMKVPTHVAANEQEFKRALELTAGAELVLVDTAGRSKTDEVMRQAKMLHTAKGLELALCLSAATGPRELAVAAARFAMLKPSRLIFTKLDEAFGPGSLVSALAILSRPIACVTDGQRVPEDIHALDGPQLVDLVAGHFKPR